MATLGSGLAAPQTPTDIVALLTLVRGTSYTLTNESDQPMKIAEANAAPSAFTAAAHTIPPRGRWPITVGTEKIWCWILNGPAAVAATPTT